MLTASPPATTSSLPWVALRAFWRGGAVVAVGDVLQLTRGEAAELLAAHKIGPAAYEATTLAPPASLPAPVTAPSTRRPRKPKGG